MAAGWQISAENLPLTREKSTTVAGLINAFLVSDSSIVFVHARERTKETRGHGMDKEKHTYILFTRKAYSIVH